MEKILLIDGNSMLFRAYYATKFTRPMISQMGVKTNAVFTFSNMLTKTIRTLNPDYILVAFDTGDKTFRHDRYEAYKGTRSEVDEDLVAQFSLVREFLDAYPLQRLELNGYEADDIIGTIAEKYTDYEVDILTSDRDMLQLVNDRVHVVLMRKGVSDILEMTPANMIEEIGLRPQQIIDLKALMGDASDNIPGVPSVGQKTALKLLAQYDSLDGVYEHADEIKGKLGEKIRAYKDQAYLSYELATIHKEIPLDLNLEKARSQAPAMSLNAFYRTYDMNSLVTEVKEISEEAPSQKLLEEIDESWLHDGIALALDLNAKDEILGFALSDGKRFAYLEKESFIANPLCLRLMSDYRLILSSSKELYRLCLEEKLVCSKDHEDLILLAFIVDCEITTIAKLKDKYELWFYEISGPMNLCSFAQGMIRLFASLKEEALRQETYSVYEDIEKPLAPVLAECEYNGIYVDRDVLGAIRDQTEKILEDLSQEIYQLAGKDFNINSPKQLGTVLFDDLKLPSKKNRSTAVEVLEEIRHAAPIIELILKYRKYQKLYSTYAVGLAKHIGEDQKIHTTLNQHATQTGRLSSSDPNLQNISIRDEEARQIRKAFKASPGSYLLAIDYSQIELRVLSYLAKEESMMDAFNQDKDIHVKTAQDIFQVEKIDSTMRRQAKTVNFGIIYGMSRFGLAKQLGLSSEEAEAFITRYHEVYPRIMDYMDELIKCCEKDGYVSTYFGRRRYISEIHDSNYARREFGKRAAMNAPIQGTAADIIKIAMIEADKVIKEQGLRSKLVLQVHDELIFDVVEEELELMISLMKDVMENAVSWPLKLKVSVYVGKDWFE